MYHDKHHCTEMFFYTHVFDNRIYVNKVATVTIISEISQKLDHVWQKQELMKTYKTEILLVTLEAQVNTLTSYCIPDI